MATSMNPTNAPVEHFINRELSWLEFNARVLEEAQDPGNPLLERLKFLAIFSSNLDEFFMVRVAGLREQAFGECVPQDVNPDGLKALPQLQLIARRTKELVAAQYRCWNEQVLPALAEQGIRILPYIELRRNKGMRRYFEETILPILTPTAIDPSHPRPRYQNRGLYLAALLRRMSGKGPRHMYSVVHLPQVLPRLVPVPNQPLHFIWLEDLIADKLPDLYGGFRPECSALFRITRDSDIDLIQQESDDMLRLIEERLKERRRADAVRLEVTEGANDDLLEVILEREQLRGLADKDLEGYSEIYRVGGPLDLTGLLTLLKLPNLEGLRDAPFRPRLPRGLRRPGVDLFAAIARRDVLLHHPFESFGPVVEFIQRAAQDPQVLAIKQTLYRTSGDSPIVRALMEAAERGKHVTALVELQARFDEEANVSWARLMERAGVHVVYGFMDLKTHCKVSLVVRQEGDSVRRYVHLGTGNYNPATALVYTDMGLFTADPDLATDVSALFNLLTGYSQGHHWRKLVVAPQDLHRRTVALIDAQTTQASKGKPARIFAKLNSLVDAQVIEALYRAGQAGVSIDLVIRGICCLRPGIPGVSENIRVRSIVDRFLEHSRVMVFGPDESAKIFLSSADWMPRNFYRRVEVMYPISSPQLQKRILKEIVPAYLRDNVHSRLLLANGQYKYAKRSPEEPTYRCQEELLKLPADLALTPSQLPASSVSPPGDGKTRRPRKRSTKLPKAR